MPRHTPFAVIDKLLARLTRERQEHRDALAQIDAVFAKHGIDPAQAAPPQAQDSEPPASAPPARKRRRRVFAVSGPQFVLGLLAGGKALTTAQIREQWVKAERPGQPHPSILKLLAAGKIEREPVKDGRGSKHRMA